jgi:Stage II sporulation protein E (SpoIIE)
MDRINPWQSVPRKSLVAFLLAVFFIFTTTAFANDIIVMGREAPVRFGVGVLLSGLFAAAYAVSGITLRRKFWKAFVPLFALQAFVMGWLSRSFPDAPHPMQMGVAEMGRLQSRLVFDGVGVIVAVALGYAGFIYVSISEARRYARGRMEMALLESELAAARQVQQLILPAHNQSFPGFTVESVYEPARQVGGDFFQIFPMGECGLLLVIGDVAGKGVPAAMLVALLVGSIRATAEVTHDPVLMLRRLHERLIGHIAGGFSTALAACIADDGHVTIANAGHLSPYLDGRELDLPGALPLGVAGGGEYETTSFELPAGSRLVFVSDGVVEAQNKSGELFGFDRARAISTQSADAIVEAAVRFGQSDDITVVTIERLPTGESSDLVRKAGALAPA